MSRNTYVHIHLDALKHNLKCVRRAAPDSAVLAMVKANAYGHGLIQAAQVLSDADALGVACLEEAVELRQAGITQPIVLVEGFFHWDELSIISELQLDIVVHHLLQVEALEQCILPHPLSIWLKLNTGMHRLGFAPEEVHLMWERLAQCSAVRQLRLMTHLANADDTESTSTSEQLALFEQATAGLLGERSLANSAGILQWPETHADWVRPGIMLYGISPFPGQLGLDYGLQPAMTVSSELMAVHWAAQGESVGYGSQWVCPEDMPIGVVAIGYGDGYPRHARDGTPVLLNGQPVPLVGRVSMDMITVDLRTQPHANIGDPVVLWGEGLPVEIVATYADTIAYELLCGMGNRSRLKTVISE